MASLTTSILVRLQVEGLHHWPQAPSGNIEFLRYPHRHIFHIEAEKRVAHEDRDIEIIDFKQKIVQFLNDAFYSSQCNCLNFDTLSCESIAKILVHVFDLYSCRVLEDNENGAFFVRDLGNNAYDLGKKIELFYVCGRAYSGKSTWIDQVQKLEVTRPIGFERFDYRYRIVPVSDIVRRISKFVDRKDLATTANMWSRIAYMINYWMWFPRGTLKESFLDVNQQNPSHVRIIIDGIRQPQILVALEEINSHIISNRRLIWLNVSSEERKARFNASPREKDRNISFDELNALDNQLGLDVIEGWTQNSEYVKFGMRLPTTPKTISPLRFQIV